MALYNTPSLPGLNLAVLTSTAQNQVTTPQGLNVCYLLIEQPSVGTFTPNKPDLVTSLADYRNRIGGVPTTYRQLIDYLSVAAFFDNNNGAGLLQVIAVSTPQDVNTLTLSPVPAATDTSMAYSLSINAQVLNGSVTIPTGSTGAQAAALLSEELAAKIRSNAILNSIIYVRSSAAGVIEFAPYVTGTVISISFATPAIVPANTYAVPAGAYARVQNPPVNSAPTVTDFGQSLYSAITVDQPLGFIIAPGLFATETTANGFVFAAILDIFCRGAKRQHLAYIDPPNPNFVNIPLYSTVAQYVTGQALAANALVRYLGNIYKGAGAGIVAIAPAVAATPVAVAARILLPAPVTLNGITTTVLQSINATAQIAVLLAPTALELQKFVPIPPQLLISEALAAGTLVVVEQSSASEAGLYNWRDNFNSLEGHVSAIAPYQLYNGLEVQTPYVIPASAYLAALHIKVTDQAGLATPPASDAYPLAATAGPIWDVTNEGHALLNGKGVNIIKQINGATYVFGSRTLSKNDLYNRINNRVILSAYVRTLTLALNTGIVLRALDSTGTQLAGIKTLMDSVSEAFYLAGYFDGITSGDGYQNVCSNLNNPPSKLQQGIVTATSTVKQIGMIERLEVTVQEVLLGT